MIVILDKEHPHISGADGSLEEARYQVWWDGFIFVKGVPSGAPSVKNFLRQLHFKELEYLCADLSGNFVCLILDKLSDTYYTFVDNARQGNLFYNQNVIDTSFLSILKYVRPPLGELKMEVVVEFILTGLVFSENVFFDKIRLLQRNEILVFERGRQKVIQKHLPELFLSKECQQDFVQIFANIVKSVSNRKLSIDLTGGLDTRLTVLLFRQFGASFETAICGTACHPDIVISSQLAANLGLEHHVTFHTIEEASLWQELEENFQLCDGLSNVLASHRLYQLKRDRVCRGCNLAIGASGGELYKDGGWWRTALLTRPGFNQPERTLRRLVSSGLVGWGLEKTVRSGLLSRDLEAIASDYKSKLLMQLSQRYQMADKYQLADSIFYEYSTNAPRGGRHSILDSYVPILDRELVSTGVSMPHHKRLFHRFHRELLTLLSPEAANSKTTRGDTSGADGICPLLKDSGRLLYNLVKGWLIQSTSISIDNPELYSLVRQAEETEAYFRSLKQHNVISESLRIEDVSNRYLGRLISLAMLLDEVDKSRA